MQGIAEMGRIGTDHVECQVKVVQPGREVDDNRYFVPTSKRSKSFHNPAMSRVRPKGKTKAYGLDGRLEKDSAVKKGCRYAVEKMGN